MRPCIDRGHLSVQPCNERTVLRWTQRPAPERTPPHSCTRSCNVRPLCVRTVLHFPTHDLTYCARPYIRAHDPTLSVWPCVERAALHSNAPFFHGSHCPAMSGRLRPILLIVEWPIRFRWGLRRVRPETDGSPRAMQGPKRGAGEGESKRTHKENGHQCSICSTLVARA